MTAAVLYVRVSTAEQVDNYSLATQERACRDYCEREGLTVDRVFREEGESAKTANRTQLRAPLKANRARLRTRLKANWEPHGARDNHPQCWVRWCLITRNWKKA